MTKKRVVVTGMGIVSCLGNDVNAYYQALLEGKSGISRISAFETDDLQTQIAGEIKSFDPGDYIDKKQARRIDKFIAYTIVAGKKSLELANLFPKDLENLDHSKCGVILGSGMGGMERFVEGVLVNETKGMRRVSPFFIPFVITNMGSAMLAMDLGFMGPNYSISTACATGNHSIIAAANHISKGEADLMIAGGAEAPILRMGIIGFNACKALSTRNDNPESASRPWDKSRDGFVMGEGAGVLVLESLEHALNRGAPIYAEYLGGGSSCDAHHLTEPRADGEGVAMCIKSALKDAHLSAEDIDYINAHATSTPVGDIAEINAIRKVIPPSPKLLMNATKSMIGHGLGAAGGLEAVALAMGIHTQKLHPTPTIQDPEDNLDYFVPTEAVDWNVNVGISNSFGFGGHNATIVMGRFKETK